MRDDDPDLLTVREVAALLRISRASFDRHVRDQIPSGAALTSKALTAQRRARLYRPTHVLTGDACRPPPQETIEERLAGIHRRERQREQRQPPQDAPQELSKADAEAWARVHEMTRELRRKGRKGR